MKKEKRIYSIAALIILLFSVFKRDARATNYSEFFSTAEDVTYELKKEGVIKVNQHIGLTNKRTDLRASEFTLTTSLNNLQDIRAFDQEGPLKLTVGKLGDKTEIHVIFNQIVVGLNKTLNWTLTFKTNELAKKLGKVWEITLPGISDESVIEKYSASLYLPKEFGSPSYTKPWPSKKSTEENGLLLSWTKEKIKKGGAIIGVGANQIFDFSLDYHLANPKIYKVKMEIALPPDTTYQKIYLTTLSPSPENVYTDDDGNWLAAYLINPRQSLDIKATGSAVLYPTPRKSQKLTEKEKKNYLLPQQYWETDQEIQEIASKLKTPREIYDYVVSTLNYDYERVGKEPQRWGARLAIQNKDKALCTEFTDLFIALARSAGIPAREHNGFAYTTNPKDRPLSLRKDILHAWPEYYNEGNESWIMVDPTWGKTTNGIDYFDVLDLNHFTFVIKGISSQTPYPAGSYKTDELSKDVRVTFGYTTPPNSDMVEIKTLFPQKTLSGQNINGKIVIENQSPSALHNLELSFDTTRELKTSPFPQKIAILPPFGKIELPLSFKAASFLKKETVTFVTSVDEVDQNTKKRLAHNQNKLETLPFYEYPSIKIPGLFLTLAVLILLSLTLRNRLNTNKAKI